MTNDLTLYVDANHESPWAMCAFVALEEKQLPYSVKTVNLGKKETFAAGFDARTKRIPALQRGEFWLAESVAIVEYLAESFPFPKHPRIFPENLEARATCREVQHWLRTDLMPLRAERPTTSLFFKRALAPLSAEAKVSAQRLIELASAYVKPGRTTLFDAWCIADVDLAIALQRLLHNGETLPDQLATYARANWERPSVVKWLKLPRGPEPI